MTKSEIIRFLILRSIGNFFVLFALFGVVATFGPAVYYEAQFRINVARGVKYVVVDTTMSHVSAFPVSITPIPRQAFSQNGSQNFADVRSSSNEQILIPKDTDFGIVIPKIGANAKIVPNVDPANEDEFLAALRIGIAHAKGTVFPGMEGTTYLFSHSTDNFWNVGRYNAIFYLLKDLTIGDGVVVYFENIRHNYVVYDSKIVDPSEVGYLQNSHMKGKQILIMQTCWPPGTTWKRLLVFAKPK